MTPYIAALLREREHYQRRGLQERADEVSAALQHIGHETPQAVPETTSLQSPPETTTPPRPRPRGGASNAH